MSNILADSRIAALRQERANEYFQEAARPFFNEIAHTHALFSEPKMIVSEAGDVLSIESTLPEFAQSYVEQCRKSIELCKILAFNEAMNYYP